jgi:hypothetical protein
MDNKGAYRFMVILQGSNVGVIYGLNYLRIIG